MYLIAAADKNWGIGANDKLLVSIPADMKQFREKTSGKTVILGRKTLQTFPGGKPLKNRRNIILSTDPSYKVEGAEVVHSVEEAVALCQDLASEDVYVIGGGTVYKAFLPYCDTAYITALDYAYSADTFMPNLEQDPEWEMTEESDEQTYFNVIYSFKTYRRK